MSYCQIGILGKTGCGKSYLTSELIQNFTRCIIVDPCNQIKNNSLFKCNDIFEFIKKIANKKTFKLSCIFENIEDYNALFVLLWKFQNYLLVIDEISIFADNYNIDSNLQDIITRGRLKNISLLWNSQRPSLINRTLTSQAWVLIYFQLTDIRDLAYIPAPLKETVFKLPFYKFLCTDINLVEDFFRINLKKYLTI